MSLNVQAIHDSVDWPVVLADLGIDETFLRNRPGPCPACGGRDRYRFDNRRGKGDFFCNGCNPGTGFDLLMRVHAWTFAKARRAVIEAAGLDDGRPGPAPARRRSPATAKVQAPAQPTARVRDLLRTSTTPDAVPDAIAYLRNRFLWPLPPGCTVKAHAGAEYWNRDHDGRPVRIGRFPALLGEVVDVDGELVTLHATYLEHGHKLDREGCDPRKLLGKLTGRRGRAIRLLPLDGDEFGIAEGIETALAASVLHDSLPVWAATNTTLLAKFVPPPGIRLVRIFADRDDAGLVAAIRLKEQLDGQCDALIEIPPPPFGNDWADVLAAQAST